MGTKTADETGAETGTEAKSDDVKSGNDTVDITKDEQPTEAAADTEVEVLGDADAYEGDDIEDLEDLDEAGIAAEKADSGVGQGAAAVASAVLGFVSLTGSWMGTVAAARETLVGQLHTASQASVATQIKEVYGDAWQTTALWAGIFALLGLLVGVAALARPAFGAPGKPQAAWIKSVSWAGVALGVLGLLLAVLKYTDVLLGLPSAP
ncbi:membrane protein [Streptomyces sp. NRRL WC-3618]|uniref:hypothetical protein n=1 Tax=Streptomyces sp. NRRL WC-3618 TaxID=1519490 RepID=UPI0006AF8DC7|nr:hypothetical protein [Streptomyces sp. NRRL WC-3618]KOV88767.1 membrane protein [Streptomyces sp. NRRL WC-3618]